MKQSLFALALMLTASVVYAQSNPTWNRDTYVYGSSSHSVYKLAMTDMNGDQKSDIIVAVKYTPIYLTQGFAISYRPNNGTGSFQNESCLKIYGAQNTDYAFKDMDTIDADKSGVMELAVSYSKTISGATTYHVDILKMNGSALEVYYTINVPSGIAQLVKSGYFDGFENDIKRLGDLAIGSGNKVYIYKNNGNVLPPYYKFGDLASGAPDFTIQSTGMNNIKSVSIGEFYNSGYGYDLNVGYDEVVILDDAGSSSTSFRRWKNNTPQAGANWFVQESGDPLVSTIPGYGWTRGYAYKALNTSDFNADNKQDFIYEPGIRLNASGSPLSWPTNVNREVYCPTFPPYPAVPEQLAVADINNDGKNDVISNFSTNIDYWTTNPFVCYNDGANSLPDDNADIDFYN